MPAYKKISHAARDFIKPNCHCRSSGGAYKITETASGARNKSLSVRAGAGSVVVWDFDSPHIAGLGDPIYPYFQNVAGLCSKADAIAFWDSEDSHWIFIFELKSAATGSASHQIVSTAELCEAIAKRFKRLMRTEKSIRLCSTVFMISSTTLKNPKAGRLMEMTCGDDKALVVHDKEEIFLNQLAEQLRGKSRIVAR